MTTHDPRRSPREPTLIDVAALGVHESTRPTLTTVINPVVAMTRLACELLLDQIATGQTSREAVIFPTSLFPGDSA